MSVCGVGLSLSGILQADNIQVFRQTVINKVQKFLFMAYSLADFWHFALFRGL